VLVWAGLLLLGQPPTGDASGRDVALWFLGQGWHVRAAVWCWTLEAVAFSVFAALARHRLPTPHRDVFLIGAIAFIVETAVSSWFWAGLSWHAAQLEPATARTVLDVASFWGPVLNGATITMLAAVVPLSWGRRAMLPRWIGVLGAVALVEQTIESAATIFGQSGFVEPGGAMNMQLGATLVSVWALCLGIILARRSEHDQPTEGTAILAQPAAG